jgi:hypothetical protein
MATTTIAMIATMAAIRRSTTNDAGGRAGRRGLFDATLAAIGVAIGGRRAGADPRASPAGRIPSACNRDADAAYRFDAPCAGPDVRPRAGALARVDAADSVPVRGPTSPVRSQRGRPVIRRSVHIPMESSTIVGSRARPASSRGMKRTMIAMKPRTTSAPTIHSTGDGSPQTPHGPSPA